MPENLYHKLLKVDEDILNPDYYQLLGLDSDDLTEQQIETQYKAKMQLLQNVRSTKYKDFVEFLKGEVRTARRTLSDAKRRRRYDLEVQSEAISQMRELVRLFIQISGNLTEIEETEILHRGYVLNLPERAIRKLITKELERFGFERVSPSHEQVTRARKILRFKREANEDEAALKTREEMLERMEQEIKQIGLRSESSMQMPTVNIDLPHELVQNAPPPLHASPLDPDVDYMPAGSGSSASIPTADQLADYSPEGSHSSSVDQLEVVEDDFTPAGSQSGSVDQLEVVEEDDFTPAGSESVHELEVVEDVSGEFTAPGDSDDVLDYLEVMEDVAEAPTARVADDESHIVQVVEDGHQRIYKQRRGGQREKLMMFLAIPAGSSVAHLLRAVMKGICNEAGMELYHTGDDRWDLVLSQIKACDIMVADFSGPDEVPAMADPAIVTQATIAKYQQAKPVVALTQMPPERRLPGWTFVHYHSDHIIDTTGEAFPVRLKRAIRRALRD